MTQMETLRLILYSNSIDLASHSVNAVSNQAVGDGSTQWPRQPASEIAQTYEAGGRPSKRTSVTRQDDRDPETGEYNGVLEDTLTDHYIYSSVLGAQVVDLEQNGQANIWVYAGGRRIATAITGSNGNTTFEHHNPETTSRVTTNGHSSYRTASRDERDAQTAPVVLYGGGYRAANNFNQPLAFEGGDPSDFASGVTLDGMPVTRAQLAHDLDTGSAVGTLFVGGKEGVSFDFTGHGQLGLDYLSGVYGSLRIGIGTLVKDSEVDTRQAHKESDDIIRTYTEAEYGYHWEYSFVDVSFSGQSPQNPSPTPPAQPLPPNYRPPKPLEQPCIDRTNDVRRDISAIAKTLHGKAGALQRPDKPFPGAQIDPGGQSFGKVVNTLYKNGYSENYSLDHPEGWGFQKKFNDGLWYHVIVDFPKGTDTDLFGNLQLNQRAPTPLVTVHCHATNPNGAAHIIDRIFGP